MSEKYDATKAELVAKGFKVTRLLPATHAEIIKGSPAYRHVRPETITKDGRVFDFTYEVGRLPQYVKRIGNAPGVEHEDSANRGYTEWTTAEDQSLAERRFGYNRPAAEEPYIEALADFFADRIALMPPKARQDITVPREWLRSVMYDTRPLEDKGKNLGITKQAVQQAQQRAVDQLVESCGGKEALAEKLRQYLHDKEMQDGRDRLKYLPRWVHG